MTVKDLRLASGLSQKEFSEWFNIPISTLRKWEQGDSKAAPYIVQMMSRLLPVANSNLEKIVCADGKVFFYNDNARTLSDSVGNTINIHSDIQEVKKENLALYVEDLFQGFYEIQEKFKNDCELDKREDIIWS